MTPRQFGHYDLVELLGSGGMGVVYRAMDTRHDREVALKLLPENLSADREYQARFRRESLVAARLREPHVIPIHHFGEFEDRLYIDMRLVDGKEIGTLLEESGPLSASRAVHLIGQVAEALDAAHAAGLVHRDIKPSNVLVTANDFVYVVDFGIAQSIGPGRTSLTITGATVGTLDYMAPERFTNADIDGRADVYALACLLHECLTATRPFQAQGLPALMYAHLYVEPPLPTSMVDDLPAGLDAVVGRGMAKDPQDRYMTAGALAEAARAALLDTGPGSAPRNPRAPATVHVDRPDVLPSAGGTVNPPHRPPPGIPISVGSVGLAAENSSHRSVNRLEPPGLDVVAPGQPPVASPRAIGSPFVPPPGGPRRRRRRGPLLAGVSSVAVAAALLVLILTVVLSPSPDQVAANPQVSPAQTADTSQRKPAAVPSPARPEPVTVAVSLAVPTLGPTVDVEPTPGYIEVAPNGRFAYIAHRNAGVITVLDTTSNSITSTIPIPQGPPQFISFSQDGRRAYVSIFNDEYTINLLAVLDTEKNEVIGKPMEVGERPFASATTPDGRLLYVPSHNTGRIDIIDTTDLTKKIVQVPVKPNPHWVAFGLDGRFAYAANHESGLLTVLDVLHNNRIVAEIPVGTSPHSVAVSPDGTRVSVVCFTSNDVYVIDTATNKVVQTVPVGLAPQDIAYAPDGRYFYTADVDSDTISVVSTDTYQRTAYPSPGDGPTSIAVLPNGLQAYVTNLNSQTVRILDIGRA